MENIVYGVLQSNNSLNGIIQDTNTYEGQIDGSYGYTPYIAESASLFPSEGKDGYIYISKTERSISLWDSLNQRYYQINQSDEILEIIDSKVPKRLSTLTNIGTTTKNTRLNTNLYVDNNGSSKKISLQDIKELNTKIISTSNKSNVDINELSIGDYIYSEN